MADVISVGGVAKIIEIALKIKEAVETVKQNEKECHDIEKCVALVTALIKRLDEITEVAKDEVMRQALDDLTESLQGALELVIKCQRKHVVRRYIGAMDMAKELRRVQEDIVRKVTIGTFATTVVQLGITLMTIAQAAPRPQAMEQDVGMDKTSHGGDRIGDTRPKRKKTEVITGCGSSSYSSYGLTKFSFSQLEAATDNFSKKNEIGHGGFGIVFKGVLPSGVVVAVKTVVDEKYFVSEEQFVADILEIARLQHKNVVKTLGYCIDHEMVQARLQDGQEVEAENCRRMLVVGYMPNGSLADTIIRGTQRIYWSFCFRIIQGIAQGLHYLHEQNIIHLDLKPENILFDSDMNPVIVDFGLSTLLGRKNGVVGGTLGYIAPEYFTDGNVSKKFDVFAFGIVIFRTITGSCTNVESAEYRHYGRDKWDEILHGSGRMKELFDPALVNESELTDIEKCVKVGLRCTEFNPADRPTMAEVLEMLIGGVE